MRIFILTTLILSLFVSCHKDLGNYDYTNIEDITIDSIPEKLGNFILFEDTIRIEPVVGPLADFEAENFNYYWSKRVGVGAEAKMERFSEEKDLVLPVTESNIQLRFEVEHKRTGVVEFVLTSAVGTSVMANGIYLLKETAEGATDLDMVRFDDKTNEATFYYDLMVNKYGQSLAGKPITLDYWGYRVEDLSTLKLVAKSSLRIASEQDLRVLNIDDFEELASFDDLFTGGAPEVRNIQALKTIDKVSVLMNNDKLHVCKSYHSGQNSLGQYVEAGYNRYQQALYGDYQFSPKLTWRPQGSEVFLAYDSKNGVFKYIKNISLEPTIIKEYPGKNAFEKALDTELLFMESTATGVFALTHYALMQKREHPDTSIFITMDARSLVNGYLTQDKRDTLVANESSCNIGQASHWCVHQLLRTIYFAKGNKVYRFNPGSKTEELILTLDKEISFLDCVNEYYVNNAPISSMDYAKLVVATYDGDSYSLYKYDMDGISLMNKDADPLVTGQGKIKDYLFIKPDVAPASWMKTYN